LRLVGAAQSAAHGFCQLQCTNLSFLEYDYYQDDKFGRILAYVWENCTSQLGCNNGQRMVNWLLVKKGIAKVVTYQDRRSLKYKDLLLQAEQ